MTRALRVLFLAALVVVALPHEAAAQRAFMEWLEKLSGPGPFTGVGVELPVYCKALEQGERVGEAPSAYVTVTYCGDRAPDTRRVSLVLGLGWFSTGENPLPYDPPFVEGDTTAVRAFRFVFAPEFRLHRAVDVGIGVGMMRFSGDRFDSFGKFVFQPIRLNVRPLSFAQYTRGGSWREFLVLSLVSSRIQTIDADEFGAVGDFDTGGEFNQSLLVQIDVLRLLEGLR